MGFCIYNNCAIAAHYLIEKYKYKKIAIFDPDVHHGNGTQDIFFDNKNISPCLEFGLVGKTMHKVDEAVSLKDLKKLTKIYANILDNYFS